jgi:hypothetical protein
MRTNRERSGAETVPGDKRDRGISPAAQGVRGASWMRRFLDFINGEGW